jgi:hypothetical protein
MGVGKFGNYISTLGHVIVGSSFSLRSCIRLSSNASIMKTTTMGSSFSLRNFVRLSSGCSILG